MYCLYMCTTYTCIAYILATHVKHVYAIYLYYMCETYMCITSVVRMYYMYNTPKPLTYYICYTYILVIHMWHIHCVNDQHNPLLGPK